MKINLTYSNKKIFWDIFFISEILFFISLLAIVVFAPFNFRDSFLNFFAYRLIFIMLGLATVIFNFYMLSIMIKNKDYKWSIAWIFISFIISSIYYLKKVRQKLL